MKTCSSLVSCILLSFLVAIHAKANHLSSPNGRIQVNIDTYQQTLYYSVDVDGQKLINRSKLGLHYFAATLPTGPERVENWNLLSIVPVHAVDESWRPVFGKRSQVRNHYREIQVNYRSEISGQRSSESVIRSLFFRVYNDGIAFRHRLAGEQGDLVLGIRESLSEINFAERMNWSYYQVEKEPVGPEPAASLHSAAINYPAYAELDTGVHVALLEAHLRDAAPMRFLPSGKNNGLRIQQAMNQPSNEVWTPWRVVMIGDEAGQLIDSDLLVNLNPKAERQDHLWMKPGVCFWDWRAHGYVAPDGFKYDINFESWKRFIDLAAETGVPYLVIDANWYGEEFSAGSNPFTGGRAGQVKQAIRYGQQKGVGLILYLNHVAAVEYGIERIIKAYRDWGAKGIKYGFMKYKGAQQTIWTHHVAELCTQYHLMVNFHDGPVPPTGEEAYLPSLVNREFCHAQSDGKRVFSPSGFLKMVHVNMLAGPLDMNNGMFDLNQSAEERPKVFQQIQSTVTAEAARTLITYGGGWTVIPDAADAYRKYPDLFAFIAAQKMPWDESITLTSRFGKYISMARKTGETWLVGSATNEEARSLELDLSFLDDGKSYRATVFQDVTGTHYRSGRELYDRVEKQVTSNDRMNIRMAPGSGHCMIIRPL